MRLVEQTTASWEFYLGVLDKFAKRLGHTRVPHGHREDGFKLGFWVLSQRQCHLAGKLSEDRVARLEQLPGWSWDPNQEAWDTAVAHLESFVHREGHARVPHLWLEDGYRLGQWVVVQRRSFAKGQLDNGRREQLESIRGWVWNSREASWEAGFAALRGFVEREGHSRVARDFRDGDGFRLGFWVTNQRQRRGQVTEDRARRLEALPGWTWDEREAAWEAGFEALEGFVDREGHSRVPKDFRDGDDFRLGYWVQNQRQARKRGQLSEERQRRLEALPGWSWDPYGTDWEDGYERLRRFAECEGHSRVPVAYRDEGDFSLGRWVNHQRTRQGELSEERQRRLEALPGWAWNKYEADWEDGYGRLRRFGEREGHSQVPFSYRDDDEYRLGNWVAHQQASRRRGVLSQERAQRLDALPGWVWRAR